MAQDYHFSSDLLLAEERDGTEIVRSGEDYEIDDPDPHISTVVHGRLYDGIERAADGSDFRMVSFLVFKDVSEVSEMRNQLDRLSVYSPFTIKTFCGSRLKTFDPLHFLPCLVSERIPDLTFDEWVVTASGEDALIFFRDVFSTLGRLHAKKLYFGNSRKGIRILNNRPMFVFPSRFEETKLDEGIKHDFFELHDMVKESKIPGDRERELFFKLCKKYIGSSYEGESLRQGSFFITHCPLVYTHEQRFYLVRKLHDYRDTNHRVYNDLVKDDDSSKAIPIDDIWTRLQEDSPNSKCGEYKMVVDVYTHGKKVSKDGTITDAYTNTETLRYLCRCCYEHKEDCKTLKEIDRVLYSVYPEAITGLYEMMIDRLHTRSDAVGNEMQPLIEFLMEAPCSLDF